MTREETVRNLLTELIGMIDNGSQRDLDRADEIGTSIIKLLEQEPILDKIRAEIKQYQSDYDEHGTEYDRTAWKAFNRCLQTIDKYKAETEAEDGNVDN